MKSKESEAPEKRSTGALAIGLKNSVTWRVEEQHCIFRGGKFRVFSTSSMVALMERAGAQLLEPYLESHQSSVGTIVELKHLAPTPLGGRVRAEAEIVMVDRRRVLFTAKIFDEVELVGEGKHERFIVDISKYDERLRSKFEIFKLHAGRLE